MPLAYTGDVTLSLRVKDLGKAQAWYREHLGFETLYEVKEMGWCEMKTHVPGVSVGIGQAESPAQGGGVVPVFGVEDIDAARSQLESKDVRFDGETQTIPDMVKLATFYDPDGNAFMLVQDISKK